MRNRQLDGTIAVHSIQSTTSSFASPAPARAPANPNDIFDLANFADTNDAQNLSASLSLENAPKWLKVPVGARFGFGGRLVEVYNTTGDEEKKERKVAIKRNGRGGCYKTGERADRGGEDRGRNEDRPYTCRIRPSAKRQNCAEGGEEEGSEAGTDVPGAAPSEVGAFSSDAKPVDAASTATEPSLFGDEPVGGGAAGPAAGDFLNTLASGDHDAGTTRPRAGLVPHLSYTGESSAAATIGSRGSSEDATSTLVTRALITGNLDTAVELCIQAGRWADALLLAQGDGLVMRTQMAYFERQQQEGGYLRVFKGVVQGRKGLTELVRGADVGEWREVMVVLCRWAEAEAFAQLAGELGERVLGEEGGADKRDAAKGCFIAGRRLDKLVRIWAEEMTEEEELAGQDAGGLYGIRATAVQHFVEKAVAFCAATGFVDPDLSVGQKRETTRWRLCTSGTSSMPRFWLRRSGHWQNDTSGVCRQASGRRRA
ncbi:protein transport protein S31 [Ceratobasidium sp. UAMH 11750]|nr:protein transport protein S31 [Ceratobasidium sp. UAMH 11750]